MQGIRSNPLGAWALDTLRALRPLWWVLRAIVVFALIIPFVPPLAGQSNGFIDRILAPIVNPLNLLLLAALLLISIQWGRGRWAPTASLRVVRGVVSVIAAVTAPFLIVLTLGEVQAARSYVMSAGVESYVPGLAVDGQRVRNIFAYDANGDPIDHVQLFDQDGRPLTTVGASGPFDEFDYYYYGGGGPLPVAEREIGRQPVWNIFPLRELPADEAMTMYGDPLSVSTGDATAPMFPFAQVPSVAADEAGDAADDVAPVEPTETPAP